MSIFLYTCETWILTAELERKILATEMRCFGRRLGIYRYHITNDEVRNRIRHTIEPSAYEDLLTTKYGLTKMIQQGTVQGGRMKARQKKGWEDNIIGRTDVKLGVVLRKAKISKNLDEWRKVATWSSLVPYRSSRLRDKWSEVLKTMWIQRFTKSVHYLFPLFFISTDKTETKLLQCLPQRIKEWRHPLQ